MEEKTRRGYDLPLANQRWQFWVILIAVALMVFNMERGFRGEASAFPWIMRCFYPLLLFLLGQEFVRFCGKLHFVPEGIAITLFGKTLRQFPRERVRQLAGIRCNKKNTVNNWICVCGSTLEELADKQDRKTPRFFGIPGPFPAGRKTWPGPIFCGMPSLWAVS